MVIARREFEARQAVWEAENRGRNNECGAMKEGNNDGPPIMEDIKSVCEPNNKGSVVEELISPLADFN